MKNKITIALCILSILISSMILVITLNYKDTPISEIKTFNCSNLTIEETAKCLSSEVSEWYFYNISNWKKDITEEQLKTEGGVCYHYSNWYSKQAESLGFISQEVHVDTVNSSHKFDIISNDDGYCVLDQTSYWCFKFAKEKNE